VFGLDIHIRHRLPVLLQVEAAECGLVCLAMVASYYGHKIDAITMRRHYPVSLKGTTLAHLIRISESLELSARPLRIEVEELHKIKCPAVLHWDLNHFVVIKSATKNKVWIHDPAIGAIMLSIEEVSKHFTGVVLELTPTPKFSRVVEQERLPLSSLWGNQHGLGIFLLQVFISSLLLEIFAIASPLFMQLVVDRVLVSGDWSFLTVLGLSFALLAAITVGITAFRFWVIVYVSTHLNYQMAARLFRHLLALPLDYFTKRHVGDIVSRFQSLRTIQATLTGKVVESLVDGIMVIGTLVVMFIYSAALSGVAISMVIGYALMRWVLYDSLSSATREEISRVALQQSNFLETVRGMQAIRLMGGESLRHAAWDNLLVGSLNAQVRIDKLTLFATIINGSIFGIGIVGITWIGASEVLHNNLSVGMLLAFLAFALQFTTNAKNLIENGVRIALLRLHSERIADIALTQPENVRGAASAIAVREFSGRVGVNKISYRYGESEQEVISNVSFEVQPGESVAITGPSGVGKSTLIKLMLGLINPTGGEVLADGISIQRFGLEHYRRCVAAVLQDDKLFAGSIADNICFFEPTPDLGRVEECARLAAVHDDIMNMPLGYQTLMGDMGTVLSGGQHQRVLLARALYREPKVLFLDEATSHLDLVCESEISDAIRTLNITRVIVAHRPETIKYANRIIKLLPGGAVVEEMQTASLERQGLSGC
jgi:ATP-binding cassette, subfamily B, bacterial CvaB/MchF/RaxB